MRFNDCMTNEGYVALQAWLVGQLDPRTPRTSLHRTGSASTMPSCPCSLVRGWDSPTTTTIAPIMGSTLSTFSWATSTRHPGVGERTGRGSRAAGQPSPAVATPAMCHAIVDTWLGDAGRHIPFVASVIASVATLELVARVRVDECVFELDLPPDYARAVAPNPWEHGGLPIGSVDSSLLVPGPTIRVEAHEPSSRFPLTSTGFAAALGKSVEMGLAVDAAQASDGGVSALLRAPHTRPEMLGWAADAVARALSECGHVGALQIRVWLGGFPA